MRWSDAPEGLQLETEFDFHVTRTAKSRTTASDRVIRKTGRAVSSLSSYDHGNTEHTPNRLIFSPTVLRTIFFLMGGLNVTCLTMTAKRERGIFDRFPAVVPASN